MLRKRDSKRWRTGIILTMMVALSLCVVCYYQEKTMTSERQINLTYLLALFTFSLILLGNFLLNLLLDLVLQWKNYAVLRFVLQILIGTLFSLACLNATYFYIKNNFTQTPPDANQLLLLNIYGSALILPIFGLFFGFKFLKAWRKSEIETERLQKENLRSQMLSLKNHLDPHFLFNNLNTVSSLIDVNQEMSKKYLDKFADVYRMILKTQKEDLTTLEEELNLMDSYIFLLKIRFEGRLFFEIDVRETDKEKAILPLSIQMLVENAIKHNIASQKKPLTIRIASNEGQYLTISNNKNIKIFEKRTTAGTGLENIRERYSYFTDTKVLVLDEESTFAVKIPLLEIDYS